MPKFIIERGIPGGGNFSPDQLQGIAAKSCDVLRAMGPAIQWVEITSPTTSSIASIMRRTRT